jgi:hypothetical protein
MQGHLPGEPVEARNDIAENSQNFFPVFIVQADGGSGVLPIRSGLAITAKAHHNESYNSRPQPPLF